MSYVFRRQPPLITARLKLYRPTSGCCLTSNLDPRLPRLGRTLTTSPQLRRDKYGEEAKNLNQKGLDEHEQEVKVRQRQMKVPWHRENVDRPPVDKGERETRAMTKGKLLTTPTRLLKLVIPMPFGVDKDKSGKPLDRAKGVSSSESIQPLALLVHPQQPLSYLERLIQAEVPPIIEDGQEKPPNIYFRAEDTPTTRGEGGAKDHKTSASTSSEGKDRPAHVAPYSGLGREGPERDRAESNWVRWSSSTEVGDFIRDAARGREFAIEVEGYGVEMRIGVPSFNDRTHYMRLRLRTMGRRIDGLTRIKQECDLLAHRGAYRLAKGGFALLSAWWGTVYYVTFHTEFGWDLVEPVTYLASLMTIMGGYLWFLYISRDLSYKAAMNVTVSRRQHALYEARGFDLHKWEGLVQEANSMRNEIRKVALEYDVDWDDTKDVGEEVKQVLDKQERKRGNGLDPDEDEDSRELQEERREEEKDKGDQKEEEGKTKPVS